MFDEETYRAVLEGGLNTFMGSVRPSRFCPLKISPAEQRRSFPLQTMPIFQILSDIARLSPSLSSVLSDTATDEDPKKRIESFLALSSKIQLLEARLDACYPTFHANEGGNGSGTAPYHFAAFRCYSITARLYLKQIVLHRCVVRPHTHSQDWFLTRLPPSDVYQQRTVDRQPNAGRSGPRVDQGRSVDPLRELAAVSYLHCRCGLRDDA